MTAGKQTRAATQGWRGTVAVRICVVVVAILAAYQPVRVHAACREVFFRCDLGDREEDRSVVWRVINLKSLRATGRNDLWIKKKCRVDFVEPDGCDWKSGVGGGGTAGSTVVLPGAGYSPPMGAPGAATTLPATTSPGVRRDAWGKRTPTPAPAREEASAPVALADDGPWAAEIAQAAARYRLPAALIRAVMQVESGGNPQVVSNKGAVGLMQLLPATATALGVEDVHDPGQNILGGARFLRVLANKFEGDLVKVLSAYHAGSMRVVTRDATPFAATDDYVRKILKSYYQLRDAALKASE